MTDLIRKRANYFANETGSEEFHWSFVKLLTKIRRQTTARYLRPENAHRFKHGGKWAHPAAPESLIGEIEKHSSQASVPFMALANHDLTVIDMVLTRFASDMERQFAHMMYSTVSAAAASVGNTVRADDAGSLLDALAAMLEKVQFSADKFGNITPPEIHMGEEMWEKLQELACQAPPEFEERMQKIILRKTAEAKEAEACRKARFLQYGRK